MIYQFISDSYFCLRKSYEPNCNVAKVLFPAKKKIKVQKANPTAPSGNRTQGKCLEGIYVTTTPMVLTSTCSYKYINILQWIIFFLFRMQCTLYIIEYQRCSIWPLIWHTGIKYIGSYHIITRMKC